METSPNETLQTRVLALAELPVVDATRALAQLLTTVPVEQFLVMMFSPDEHSDAVRRFIGSLLDEYDQRRPAVLKQLAASLPVEHQHFFVHAFGDRNPNV